MNNTITRKPLATTIALFLLLTAVTAFAQSTAFTHQGRLTDNGATANGLYDLQFALFDALSGGAQQGATITRDDVPVTNGVFTVQLDFGATPFNGAARWLQISVRAGASTGAYTLLNPRQPLSATPYAIRSQSAAASDNAAQLGGVAASQYVQTADTRLADARTPTAGSANYIQNTTTPQAASNFNISGNGTAGGTLSGNVVNAATQFNLNGARILSNAGPGNLFAGENAGAANSTGFSNAFVGFQAGQANVTGSFNAFSGQASGRDNTTGAGNSFFGALAGLRTTTGDNNAFVGVGAGRSNTTGFNNAFVGAYAGESNTTGGFNVLIGRQAGQNVTTGSGNVFLGNDTGVNNLGGSSNTLIGAGANVSSDGLSFATAIGSLATVSTNNTIVLGRGDGSDSVRVPGAIFANGGIDLQGGLALNNAPIRLRGGADSNHAIFYNSNVDGIEFRANDQFVWSRANGNTSQMTLRGNGVLVTRGGFNGRCVSLFAGDGVCNQDLAETFRTKEQTEAGDVVTLIPQDHARPTVRRSLRAYDEHLVGVVSTNPGLVFDEGDTKLAGENDHYITKEKTVVAAVGRVPVKFTLENGAINVGDALTSSATEPGKAMKATGAGKIIGIALESSAKARDGKLLLWLQVGYHAPAAPSLTATQRRKTAARGPSGPSGMTQLKAENAALQAQQNGQQQQLAELKAQLAAVLARLPKSDQAVDKQASEQH